jgi:hypothetical protein
MQAVEQNGRGLPFSSLAELLRLTSKAISLYAGGMAAFWVIAALLGWLVRTLG